MLVSPQNGTSLQVGSIYTDGVTVFSQWPLQHFFDYIFSFDSIVSNLQYPRECQGELWIIVRGDGLPCGGESWCQMSISFANHGHLARTLSYHWTVNVALCGEKSTSVLSRMRNCGSARYLFFSARYTLSSARNVHYRARYAVFKRRNP